MVYGWLSEKVSRLKAFYEEKAWDIPPKYLRESEMHVLLVPGIAFICQEVISTSTWLAHMYMSAHARIRTHDCRIGFNASYRKQREYIWFIDGILNHLKVIVHI